MTERSITLHAFCSIKGGVGKSTLAVACARLLAEQDRQAVLIDADLTGTSLADGLELVAPDLVPREDGTLDLSAPPTGRLLTTDETVDAMLQRAAFADRLAAPAGVPFFNDILTYQNDDPGLDCRMDALFWHHALEDGVRYLPSSSMDFDVERALPYLLEDQDSSWTRRFAWILAMLTEQLPDLTDIIVDLPPGLFGFAHAVLNLISHLEAEVAFPEGFPDLSQDGSVNWKLRPYLVTTRDANDLYAALRFYNRLLEPLPNLVPLVNRVSEGWEQVLEQVRKRTASNAIERRLVRVADEPRTLGRVFFDRRLQLDRDVASALRQALRIGDT